MKRIGSKRLFILLLVLWFFINLLQAIYTEINEDEAYYFLYGKYLDWGYFDHPPLVGLIVHISSWFFDGNLGVRFVTVLLQVFTLILTWLLIDKSERDNRRSVLCFFVIAGASVLFNVYGFTTTPDVPLLFFTALFLLVYKKFLDTQTWPFTLLMVIAMAGLVYSKYQGVLVIGFVVLFNIRLLLNPRFLIASGLALTLCMPHFYWQFAHEFPSFKYHLVSRANSFKWSYFLEFLLNQLAAFNPFVLGAVLYVIIRYRPVQKFEKAQYFIIIGLITFFWLSTFRGRTQPQWTVAASIPIIVLLHKKTLIDDNLRRYVQKFIGASLLLVLVARVILVTDLLPAKLKLHSKKAQYVAIEKLAKNKPVIFAGSYQNPSLYTFFSGKPATVVSELKRRKTQFDIWHFEQNWHNDAVFVAGKFVGKSKAYEVDGQVIDGFFADSFQTTAQLKINYNFEKDSLRKGDVMILDISIDNPTQNDINLTHPEFPATIQVLLIKDQRDFYQANGNTVKNITLIKSHDKLADTIKFTVPDLPKGDYKLGIGYRTIFGPALNSDTKNVTLF
jgi:hypothetical protein